MKSFLIIAVAAAFLFVSASAQKTDMQQQEEIARAEVERAESKFFDSIARGGLVRMADVYELKALEGGRHTYLAALGKVLRRYSARLDSIARDERSVSFEPDGRVVSTGRMTFILRDEQTDERATPVGQITATPIEPSVKSTVNVRELAQREAARPPATESHGVAAPEPRTIDDSRAHDAAETQAVADVPRQFPYKIVYVKDGDGWRVFSFVISETGKPE